MPVTNPPGMPTAKSNPMSIEACQKRLDDRYNQYLKDSESASAANNSKILGGLLDALMGFAAGVASKLVADMINTLIEKSGARDALAAGATLLLTLLTIGPQMYLALFAVCVEIIGKQAEARIKVATEVRNFLDVIISIYGELLILPNPKGTLIQRIQRSSRQVKYGFLTIGKVTDSVEGGGPFLSYKYREAMDYIGSAIDYLAGGDGKGRPQTDAAGVSDYVNSTKSVDDFLEETVIGTGEELGDVAKRTADRLKRLTKRIQTGVNLAALCFLAVLYRTVTALEVLLSAKVLVKNIQPNTTAERTVGRLTIKSDTVDIEQSGPGVLGLTSSLQASIAGLNKLDQWIVNDGEWSAIKLATEAAVNALLDQRGKLKSVHDDMEIIIEEKDSVKAMLKSPAWSAQLECIWQMGQSGGPIGAIAEDLGELQAVQTSYKVLKEYLSSDIDWTRGYNTLSYLAAKNLMGIFSLSSISKIYNSLITMREITNNGIHQDQILVNKINAFDPNTPLLKEAKALLNKLGGGFADSLASGDASAFLGKLAIYAGQAGSVIALAQQAQDLACVKKLAGVDVDVATDEETEVAKEAENSENNNNRTATTAKDPGTAEADAELEENAAELGDFSDELIGAEGYESLFYEELA